MNLLENKKLIDYIITPFVVIGTFPLVSEINQSSKPFFSQNYVKWIVLWAIFYSKIEDIRYSSIATIATMLAVPSVFFGKNTHYTDVKTK